jgi:L-threonylcarbamoyladenylate synthase
MMPSDRWAEQVPAVAWELMEVFWPGPLTLILKKQAWVPSTVTGGQDTVGLRVPGHPVALELLRRFAASGGHGGHCRTIGQSFWPHQPDHGRPCSGRTRRSVPLILDGGPCAVGIESTIVDCSRGEPVVLRPGHISPAN